MKGIVNVVTRLVIAVVAIMIGAILIGQLQHVATTLTLPSEANTSISNLFSQTWGAYGLLIIVPLILVAAVIIGIMGGWGRGRGR